VTTLPSLYQYVTNVILVTTRYPNMLQNGSDLKSTLSYYTRCSSFLLCTWHI